MILNGILESIQESTCKSAKAVLNPTKYLLEIYCSESFEDESTIKVALQRRRKIRCCISPGPCSNHATHA